MRAPRALLGPSMSAEEKTFETKIADLIRMFGTENEHEAKATWWALKRLLASRGVSFTDLGNAIEKLATGGLEEAELKRVFDAGYAKGVAETKREHAEAQAVFGLRPDGSPNWEAMAVQCQREKARIEVKYHKFVDDMAADMTWGREPSDKQGKFILSLFRQVGGRMQ
jgi:hypothetical protein